MIGLLFVFIILVVVLALERQRQAAEINEIRNRPTPEKPVFQPPIVGVTESIGQRIKSQVPTIEVHPATGVLTLPEDMLFSTGKADLNSQGIDALKQIAEQLAIVLPCYVAKPKIACPDNPSEHEIDTIFVEGHTDSQPLARLNYDNFNLSFDRARAVYSLLLDGPQADELRSFRNANDQPLFSMSGYADTRWAPGATSGLDAKNRRVDLRIVLTYKKPLDDALSNVVLNKKP
jgi:flagellar motor protein MotB